MSQVFFELGAEPERPSAIPQLLGDDRRLVRAALIFGAFMTAWRVFVICNSNLMWDEAHFMVSGRHLAAGYPDIPGGFPWLSWLLTSIFGWSVVPLRIYALLMAVAMPFAVYFMALPVTTRRDSVWAAVIAMLAPGIAMNGTLFYPEGTMQVLLALMCGCLLRALDGDAWKWWALTGLFAALGLLTHFRFLLPGAGILVFLIVTPQGRHQWTRPGLYLAASIALLGLLPSLIYNSLNGWPALQFHILARPRFDFHPVFVLSFLMVQVGSATPIFLAAALVGGWKVLRAPFDRHTVLAIVAITVFGFYSLLALIDKRVMPHWAWMALVPALALVPEQLRTFVTNAPNRAAQAWHAFLVGCGPVLGILTGIGLTLVGYTTAHADAMPLALRQFAAETNEDWSRVLPLLDLADARARARFGPAVVWAAGGHRAAARLEVLGGRPLYSQDEPFDEISQFTVARRAWNLGPDALANQAGKGAVLVLDEPQVLYHDADTVAFYKRICTHFDSIEEVSRVDLPPGRIRVHLFTARVRAVAAASANCPLLPALYVARPLAGAFVDAGDHKHYFGMAADPKGITRVDVLIDHRFAAATRYGLDPQGARAPDVLAFDPNYPKVQFDFDFPKGTLKPGEHTLSIVATRNDGTRVESDPKPLFVK